MLKFGLSEEKKEEFVALLKVVNEIVDNEGYILEFDKKKLVINAQDQTLDTNVNFTLITKFFDEYECNEKDLVEIGIYEPALFTDIINKLFSSSLNIAFDGTVITLKDKEQEVNYYASQVDAGIIKKGGTDLVKLDWAVKGITFKRETIEKLIRGSEALSNTSLNINISDSITKMEIRDRSLSSSNSYKFEQKLDKKVDKVANIWCNADRFKPLSGFKRDILIDICSEPVVIQLKYVDKNKKYKYRVIFTGSQDEVEDV